MRGVFDVNTSFGTRLRLQREREQISLADIAERTKIRLSLLEALERDDVRHWPSGIFRRSYLRAYARAIDLDPEVTVREFLALYPDPMEQADDVLSAAQASDGADPVSRRPRTRLQIMFGSALDAIAGRDRHATNTSQQVRRAEASGDIVLRSVSPDESARGEDEFLSESEHPDLVPNHESPPARRRADNALRLSSPAADDGEERYSRFPFVPLETADDRESVFSGALDPALDDVPSDAPGEAVVFPVDIGALAHLCSRIARARTQADVAELMPDVAEMLHADGLIYWMWDRKARVLWPSISHGYQPEALRRMPRIKPDADNALADAFRTRELRVVEGDGDATGAVVVPVITPISCAGVLALELKHGGERQDSIQALATIVAAQLAALTYVPPIAQSEPS